MPTVVLFALASDAMMVITSVLVGFLSGCLITASLFHGPTGRAVIRTLGTVLLAIGAGTLVWSVQLVFSQESMPMIGVGRVQITQVGEAIGWGAGFTVAGLASLVLSFFGTPARR